MMGLSWLKTFGVEMGVRVGVVLGFLACFCVASFGGSQVTNPSQVVALQAIKRSFIDPANNLISWNRGDPCKSMWIGIKCFNRSASDSYLHIQDVQLMKLNLSGKLAPEFGQLIHLEILDVMWNNISGSIPKEIGNLTSLVMLLLNGNQLSGSLPDGLGYLPNLNRLQIDENDIAGSLPNSFKNLINMQHLHMNNNSISGQIPPDICRLPKLVHFLLDNNNLSGHLAPEFSESKTLLIIQLDNNNFSGSSIPSSYGKIKTLVKLSLRHCSLEGGVPDLSEIPELSYLDFSQNQLEGPIPSNRLSKNITTIDFSSNKLNGSIPSDFSYFPVLQFLSLKDNFLTGSLESSIWDNMSFNANGSLILDMRNNSLSNISGGVLNTPPNTTVMLQDNPICLNESQGNMIRFCGPKNTENFPRSSSNLMGGCLAQTCPKEGFYEYNPSSNVKCFCAAPLRLGYRLKSPAFSDFRPYMESFQNELSHDLGLIQYQLYIDSYIWEEGPRLRMNLKLFPNLASQFNISEVRRIRDTLATWKIHNMYLFGPYELLNFTLLGPYSKFDLDTPQRKDKCYLVGIVLGTFAAVSTICVVISIIIMKKCCKYQLFSFKRHSLSNSGIKFDGLKEFTFKEMVQSTDCFSKSAIIGRGGYGHVYKGILADGTVVAIKRADEGSLQGSNEFFTEIEFLSRLHHKNLVSLVGYCDEESDQMLIYEFLQNGTLRDHLSTRSKKSLDFSMRLRIALGSAKGILYLHTEADPPILHRDIKASNILLDSMFIPKVADFGLSRLAPAPDDEGIPHGHVSTVVRGTPGYIDPEYFLTHKLTDKSDVYSLGVVLMELLTGNPPISNGRNIVRQVRFAHQRGNISSIVDQRMDCYPPESMEKCVSLALRCCDGDTHSRPPMSEVVHELEDICWITPGMDSTPTEFMVSSSSLPHSGDTCKSSSSLQSDSQNGGESTISLYHNNTFLKYS